MAARCPACATVFRVVQDQLRVSEGWVRCGRCAEVFNAIENLVDLDVDVASLTSTRSPGSERVMHDLAKATAPLLERGDDAVPLATRGDGGGDDDSAASPPHAAAPPSEATPAAAAAPLLEHRSAPAPAPAPASVSASAPIGPGFGAALPDSPTAGRVAEAPAGGVIEANGPSAVDERMPAPAPLSAVEAAVPVEPAALDLRAEPRLQPRFVRMAERAAWWRRPAVRAALASIAAVLGAALSLQVAFEYRDLLAARWPTAKPWLAQGCAAIGCSIAPLRAIEGLAVDSSGLVRVEGTPLYRLSVVLRNRSGIALAVPSVDLTLTDSQGGVVARRVIEVAQLGGTGVAEVAALTELTLQTTLGVGDRMVSGYTIEIFYP